MCVCLCVCMSTHVCVQTSVVAVNDNCTKISVNENKTNLFRKTIAKTN